LRLIFVCPVWSDQVMHEETFTWEQIIGKILARQPVDEFPTAAINQFADKFASWMEREKRPGEKPSNAREPDLKLPVPRWRGVPSASEVLAWSPNLRNAASRTDLETFCRHGALLGQIGRHPACFVRMEQGRKGRPSKYFETAVERVTYIVIARAAGLGPERIKGALEQDIKWSRLQFCSDARNFKYAVTRPLLFLLNCSQLDRNSLEDEYFKLSGYLDGSVVSTPAMDMALWRDVVRMYEKEATAKRSLGTVSAFTGGADLINRDLFLLRYYLSDKITSTSYLADFQDEKVERSKTIVEAIRRVAKTKPRPDRSADFDLLKPFILPNYAVEIEAFQCSSTSNGKVGARYIYKYRFRPRDEGITLLQQAASHLFWIARMSSWLEWIRPCSREPCQKYFYPFDLTQEYCDGHRPSRKRK